MASIDSTTSGGGGVGGWIIYLLPLLAQPGSPTISGAVSAAALLLGVFFASAIAVWAFPGGPAWGRKILLGLGSSSSSKNSWARSRFIPGPRGFPIVGSLLQMGGLAHRRLQALSSSLNARRLMALSLGSTRLIVTSDPEVARDILGSSAFSDRPLKQSAQQLLFGRAIGFAPYGDYWRRLRRIAAGCLFSPRRIAAQEELRQQETEQMCSEILRRSSSSESDSSIRTRPVQVRGLLQKASLGSVMGSVFGRRFTGEAEAELRDMVREGFELLGAFNFADHLPALRDFDPQGVVQRCSALVPRVNAFVQKIIDEHRAKNTSSSSKNIVPGDAGDFVDVLLSLQGEDKLEDSDIIAVLWEMIFRGTDTTAILTEWTLAELLLNPEIQGKLQDEIDGVCTGGAAVRDCDVDRMPFLQAVVNETLRLHPPGPLLSWARLATHDVDVAGYHVPAGTTAMVNMWAITHDASVWSDPLAFKPQRFMEGEFQNFDVRGSDLRLAPFGAGRRVCPGRALGLATVRLWVARLVQEFTWVDAGVDGDTVDLTEVLKLSCEMATPLNARAIPRRNLHLLHQSA